jgi:cell division septum initiation protein DivIVA
MKFDINKVWAELVIKNTKGGACNFQSAATELASLVAEAATEEANRRANASWTLMCEKMVAAEREACAKLVDDIEARCIAKDVDDPPLEHVAAAIRARGNP